MIKYKALHLLLHACSHAAYACSSVLLFLRSGVYQNFLSCLSGNGRTKRICLSESENPITAIFSLYPETNCPAPAFRISSSMSAFDFATETLVFSAYAISFTCLSDIFTNNILRQP